MLVLIAALALSDDLKTVSGKEYKRVKVSRVEPDGIVITHKTGVTKSLFSELPTEVQRQFGYGPAKIEAETAAARSGEEKEERVVQQEKPQETKPALLIKTTALIRRVIAPMTHGVWGVLVIAVALFLDVITNIVGRAKTDHVAIFVSNPSLRWTCLGWRMPM